MICCLTSFHIDEMKEFTPWRQLKTRKTFTDHNAMVMKLVIPKSLFFVLKGMRFLEDKQLGTLTIPLAGTNSLEQIPVSTKFGWTVRMWNIPMPDGRPKSTDYCTGVSDVRELQINLMVHLIETSGSY